VLFKDKKSSIMAKSAHSGDGERSIQSIMNTGSGDREHRLALA
jgi:hypothetical protein